MAIEEFLNNILSNGLTKIILIISILIITFFTERIIRFLIKRSFDKASKIIKVDPTTYAVLRHIVSASIYLLGIGTAVYLIPSLRTLSVSIFAGAGVLAIIIGFASQKAFSNIISGIFIAMFKPFRVGDTIKFGERIGTVEDITLNHTVIKNFQNKRFVVPNSIISEQITENYQIKDLKICRFVEFNISYDSDIGKAMKIMRTIAEKHPDCLDNRHPNTDKKDPIVNVRLIGFGESSVNLRAYVWAKDFSTGFKMHCDLNKSIKEEFDKEGIEIPFPHRTIVYKTDIKKAKSGKKKTKK